MRTTDAEQKRLRVIPIVALLLNACGPSQTILTQHPPYHFEINNPEEMLAHLEQIPPKERCDAEVGPIRREIVAKIGRMKKQIDSGSASLASNDRVIPRENPVVPFQGSFLDAPPANPRTTGQWSASESSWQELKTLVDAGSAIPDGPLHHQTSTMMLSLLMNDVLRSVHGVNFGITPETIGSLKPIHESVIACHEDSGCTAIVFPTENIRMSVSKIPLYERILTGIDQAQETIAKREAIATFAQRTSADIDRYLFRGAPKLKTDPGPEVLSITLELNPGALTQDEHDLLKTTAESVWKKADAMLNVAWNSLSKDLFSVLFHIDLPGVRANVNQRDRTINLYPGTNLRTIAHEIGHVLGFPDHYYTVWDENNCSYTQLTLDTDVMSDSITGNVTETEWRVLIESLTRSAL